VSKEALNQLFKQSAELEGVGRVIMENIMADDSAWKEMYTIYNPEERYKFLMRKCP
jgi:hypothetical protein